MASRQHRPRPRGPLWIPPHRPASRRALRRWFESRLGGVDRPTTVRLGALGPKATSSDHAARAVAGLLPAAVKAEIVLFPTFEALLAWATAPSVEGAPQFAVVPNASPRLNSFYMTKALAPVWLFPLDTPDYGLAAREGAGLPTPPARVALFPVTFPILRALIRDFDSRGFEVVEAGSTSDAAALVAEGRADYAVTNAEAVVAHGLRFVKVYGPIPMTWTVFARRGRKAADAPTAVARVALGAS